MRWRAAITLAALAGPAQSDPGPSESAGGDHAVPPMVVETPAQSSEGVLPLMTLDQEALYLRSQWGERVQDELERRGQQIAGENDRLAAEFSREEQELTRLRESLAPDEFRKRADEFDKRVVEVRRERDQAARELQTLAETERTAFFRAALPILAALMRERGALAVLDQRAIFVASQSIDVTEALIARIDQEIGAGPAAPPAPGKEGVPD